MTSSLDESRDHWDTGDKRGGSYIHPTVCLGDAQYEQIDAIEDLEIEDIPTLALPTIVVDQVTTQVDLTASYTSSLSLYFSMMEGLPVEDQVTWILPVVKVAKKPTSTISQHPSSDTASLVRNLVKNSSIYAIASLTSPFISLLLAPFLAYHLSRADYGALAVLNTTISLAAGVTQLGLSSAFFRAYGYDYESQCDRLGVLSTAVILLLLVSVPIAMAVLLTAPWLSSLLFDTPSLSNPIRLAALLILLQNLAVPGLSWLRAESRAIFFSTVSVANLLAALGANIALVGLLRMGIAGSLIAVGVGYAIITVCTLPIILLRAGVHLRFDIAKGLLAFGLPNVTNFVSVWILQLSDRYLLSHLGTLAQTASYAVAYNLGSVLSAVVIAPFSLAWPAVMFAIAKRDDAAHIFRLVFRWFSILLLFAAFGLALIGVGTLNLLFPRGYASAAPIIPVIAVSIMFYGIYIVFTVGVSVQRKTWFAVIFTTLAALVNVGLNLILIHPYGLGGAALSTLLAYVVLAGVAYVVNQRLYPIPFEIAAFVVALLVGIILYTGSDFLAQSQGAHMSWGIHICALGLYGVCLVSLGRILGRSSKNKY